MEVRVFGSVGVVDADGREVPMGGPKQRTVLAVLSIDPGRPVSTDRLIAAVWGNQVPERAARSLSTYVSNLRREMGDVIESGNRSYTLRIDRSHVDVCAFSDAVDTAESTEAYREALALWSGVPFEGLDGFGAFRDEIQRLDEHRVAAKREIIGADIVAGDASSAVPKIEALVKEFPFDEGLRGLHMRALYKVGRQVEALESFNSFKRQLGEELGLDPSPELQDLELQILQQDDSLAGTRQDVSLVSREKRSRVSFPGFLTRGHSNELVGRDEALLQLDAAYASALGETQVIAVIGEPGIGKTSLTSTWAAQSVDGGAMIVAGRCTPDVALPYQPFIEIARAVLGTQPDRIRDVGPAAGNFALLVPGVANFEDLPAPIQADPDTVEYLMAEAFAAILEPSPGDPATIAILEDLHWADPQSIAVLGHLARRPDAMPLLIVANYRDTDLVSSHPLPSLLTDLHRERPIHRLLLDRLSDDQVGEMISGHFGVVVRESVVASIAEETRGNPFFIEELTRHLQDEHAIDADGQWISEIPIEEYGIPEGLRNVIGRRLSRLGPDATALLKVAAVIGPAFSIDTAGAIADLDEDRIDAVADAAIAASIIKEDKGSSEFSFSHAIVRQTLYEELSTRRRSRLHRAVGEAIEESDGEPAAALHHWLTANQSDRALSAAIRASERHHTIFGQVDARRELQLALDLWDDVDDPESITLLSHTDLVVRMAASYSDFGPGDTEVGVQLLRSEIESATNLDEAMLGRLHSELAALLMGSAHQKEAMESSMLALDLVPPDPPTVDRAVATSTHAYLLMVRGRHAEAVEIGREALAMARTVRSDYAEARVLNALATSLGMLGHMEESDGYFDEIRSLAERSGRVRDRLVVFGNQGAIKQTAGDLEGALALSDEGAAIAVELGVAGWETYLKSNAAMQAFQLGRWDEASDRIYTLEAHDSPRSYSESNRLVRRAVIGAERGTDDDLLTERQILNNRFVAALQPSLSGEAWGAFISNWRWRGELAKAFEMATEAFEVHGQHDGWTDSIWVAAYTIELIADGMVAGVGDASWLELAQHWHDRFTQEIATARVASPLQATSNADFARAKGANSAALWNDAIDAWEDGSYHQAKARWRLAGALMEATSGDPDIESNLDLAQDIAERLGAQPLLSAIDRTRQESTES